MTAEFLDLARETSRRAYVPYSGDFVGAIAVLGSGCYVPGVRVESASFGLTISAIANTCTSLYSLDIQDAALYVKSTPLTGADLVYLEGMYETVSQLDEFCIRVSDNVPSHPAALVDPSIDLIQPHDQSQMIHAATVAAGHAKCDISGFEVGCSMLCEGGTVIPGCNVEHPEWAFTLCAERNTIGTAVSYGLTPNELYLRCKTDDNCSPCGACRQVLVEHAPEMTIWMFRGKSEPEGLRSDQLLPNHFDGDTLPHVIS